MDDELLQNKRIKRYLLASRTLIHYPVDELGALYEFGFFPINDVFEPLFTEDFDIFLGYGGRGGGKSDTVAYHLLQECLDEEYFKCYYGRNVHDTIRGTIHDTIVTSIETLGLQDLFSYSKQPNGSLDIICKNGNVFRPFGGDKPDKLKSIKDPTHIWMEEADQFSLDVFTQLGATLRTLRGKNRMYLTFNTEKVYATHWLRQIFFPEMQVSTIDFETSKRILKIFVNYTDNYFIDREAYFEQLKLNSAGNMHQLEASSKGAWGVEMNADPFFYAFNDYLHLGKAMYINQSRYVDISFDFNHTPMTMVVGQYDDENGQVRVFDHIQADINTLDNTTPIDAICRIFIAKYISTGLVARNRIRVTGDASGKAQKADRRRGEDFFTDILKALGLPLGSLHLPRKNYYHDTTYKVINKVMFELNEGQMVIDEDLLFLINDVKKAYNPLDKAKKEYGLHAVDAFRYLMMLWFEPKDYERKILLIKKKYLI